MLGLSLCHPYHHQFDRDRRRTYCHVRHARLEADARPDGSVVLRFPVTNRAGFRSFVLGFLEHAEVLGPPDLREELITWLAAQAG